ncbi:protein-glutamate O-methyltransferase family protein [Oxynema sp. CENA135]|uniref:damage-control phosphatase ARMT1 family protein n=1 Tax=Oxynema sp. CENA135 TaxID=984206 RepID=UPI00190D0239|nr:damage-control phosphatase ARMT1 family protein [Oxynema sp. CENA135]MBK4731951.1 protein-glutamate O-methyltransferase family protein [Oxynema sp. CENA135]
MSYPPPIKACDRRDSWAYDTVARRLSEICLKIILENEFSPEIVSNLEKLAAEIPQGTIRYLLDTNSRDATDWHNYIQPYLGQSWLEVPWFFAETYFYRRIIEAIDYFRLQIDPYLLQKKLGLERSHSSIQVLSQKLNRSLKDVDRVQTIALIHASLWGNRVDLSLWPAEHGDRSISESEQEKHRILADDSDRTVDLLQKRGDRVDFIVDNAGFELFCDLCFADFLLTSGLSQQVFIHGKSHPTFVSDAMVKDAIDTVNYLKNHSDLEIKMVGDRLQGHLDRDRLSLRHHFFWTSPLAWWEMPSDLRKNLANSNLVIVKGDANYRRLLGDRYWSFTTPFSEIIGDFPTSILALRTMKAELACGLQPGQAEWLQKEDPKWMTNGQRGVIQLSVKA